MKQIYTILALIAPIALLSFPAEARMEIASTKPVVINAPLPEVKNIKSMPLVTTIATVEKQVNELTFAELATVNVGNLSPSAGEVSEQGVPTVIVAAVITNHDNVHSAVASIDAGITAITAASAAAAAIPSDIQTQIPVTSPVTMPSSIPSRSNPIVVISASAD